MESSELDLETSEEPNAGEEEEFWSEGAEWLVAISHRGVKVLSAAYENI